MDISYSPSTPKELPDSPRLPPSPPPTTSTSPPTQSPAPFTSMTMPNLHQTYSLTNPAFPLSASPDAASNLLSNPSATINNSTLMMSNPAILAALPNIAQAILGGTFNFPLGNSNPALNVNASVPSLSTPTTLNNNNNNINRPLSTSQNAPVFHNIADPRNPSKYTVNNANANVNTNSSNAHPFPQNPQASYHSNFASNQGSFSNQHSFGVSNNNSAMGMWDYEDDVDDEQRISELKARRAEEEKRVRAEVNRHVYLLIYLIILAIYSLLFVSSVLVVFVLYSNLLFQSIRVQHPKWRK